jgi:hypothetical protein
MELLQPTITHFNDYESEKKKLRIIVYSSKKKGSAPFFFTFYKHCYSSSAEAQCWIMIIRVEIISCWVFRFSGCKETFKVCAKVLIIQEKISTVFI